MGKSGQRLFNVGKVPVSLDSVSFGIEKRKGEDVKVVVLACRVQPFDAKLASALDAGIGGDCNIRATAFSLNTADPKQNFTRHDFTLPCPRQLLTIYATADTAESRRAYDQVKIYGTYVRTQKDMPNALALVFKASFGPADRDEIASIYAWFRGQTSVSFREADPSLDFAEDVPEPDEGNEDGGEPDAEQVELPEPEFETDAEGKPLEEEGAEPSDKEPARQRLHSHAKKNKKGLKVVRSRKKK